MEKKSYVTKEETQGGGINQELGINTHTLYIRYNQKGPIVVHGEIYLVFGGKLYEKRI